MHSASLSRAVTNKDEVFRKLIEEKDTGEARDGWANIPTYSLWALLGEDVVIPFERLLSDDSIRPRLG